MSRMLFTNIQLNAFPPTLVRLLERLCIEEPEAQEWTMMAAINIGALFKYGRAQGVLRRAGIGQLDRNAVAAVAVTNLMRPPPTRLQLPQIGSPEHARRLCAEWNGTSERSRSSVTRLRCVLIALSFVDNARSPSLCALSTRPLNALRIVDRPLSPLRVVDSPSRCRCSHFTSAAAVGTPSTGPAVASGGPRHGYTTSLLGPRTCLSCRRVQKLHKGPLARILADS